MCHAAMIRQMRERRGSRASSASGATEPLDPTPRREPSYNSRAPIDSMVTYPPQNNLATRPGPPPLGSEMNSMASETMRSGRAASAAARDVFLDDSAVEISLWPAGLISRIADEQGVGITNEVNIEREIEHAPPPRRRAQARSLRGFFPGWLAQDTRRMGSPNSRVVPPRGKKIHGRS